MKTNSLLKIIIIILLAVFVPGVFLIAAFTAYVGIQSFGKVLIVALPVLIFVGIMVGLYQYTKHRITQKPVDVDTLTSLEVHPKDKKAIERLVAEGYSRELAEQAIAFYKVCVENVNLPMFVQLEGIDAERAKNILEGQPLFTAITLDNYDNVFKAAKQAVVKARKV